MNPPKKTSAEFDMAEKKIESIRNSFIKHLEELKNDSPVLNEETDPLIRGENQLVVESLRMRDISGKSKKF